MCGEERSGAMVRKWAVLNPFQDFPAVFGIIPVSGVFSVVFISTG